MIKKNIHNVINNNSQLTSLAQNNKDNSMTRSEIANKNLKTLFNISLEDNKG